MKQLPFLLLVMITEPRRASNKFVISSAFLGRPQRTAPRILVLNIDHPHTMSPIGQELPGWYK